MGVNLTQGAVKDLVEGAPVHEPVLQLIDSLHISTGSGTSRYRLKMSDGRYFWSSFLLATQLNSLPEKNLLVPHCVCVLKRTTSNTLSDGRRVIVVLDMEILQSAEESGGLIGNPAAFKDEKRSSSEEPSSSTTSDPVSQPFAAEPRTSPMNSRAAFSPRGGGRGSPMKTTPAKPSPSAISPSGPPSSKFSPMKNSPSKFSPTKASPSTFSPAKASPSTFSPTKASPSTFSPAKASPSTFSPAKASPSKVSPKKASSSSPGPSTNLISIAQLNPYLSKWTIRARVMNKASIRNWSNSRGEGKLFSFVVVDESGEIKITVFNNEVDKFFPLVEQGKVYYISKATLKVANKQYNTLNHDYEMTLHAHSSIVPCADGQDIPAAQCDFVPIAELENRDKDAIIDVIGVCKTVEDVSRITTRTSREVSKRTLHLIDTTGKMVAATLWGEEAEKFDGSEQPVVAIKGARLSDFGGRSLSTLFSSTVMVNPDIPEAIRLRAWYDHGGYAQDSQSLSETKSRGIGARMNWKTLSEVKNENLGHGEKADYFSCVATLLYIRKDSCLYRACPSSDCNKKVIDQFNGWFRCEKCNQDFPNFEYRLLLSANLADFGDNQWVTCFQETAEVLLGHSAETLGRLRDTDEAAFDAVFQKANFTSYIFKIRVKLETYNDESRVKATVMEVQPLDHREYSRRLLGNIRKLVQ